jgi:hypothetical protein
MARAPTEPIPAAAPVGMGAGLPEGVDEGVVGTVTMVDEGTRVTLVETAALDEAGASTAEDEGAEAAEEEAAAAELEAGFSTSLPAFSQRAWVAGRTLLTATSAPHSLITQVVAGPWILSKEAQTHLVSSTEQLVVSAMALSRQGRAHEGISARDWAATRPAAAARRTAEYFILKVGFGFGFGWKGSGKD